MSRQLLKLKSLVSEIEEIQRQGQKKASQAVESLAETIVTEAVQTKIQNQVIEHPALIKEQEYLFVETPIERAIPKEPIPEEQPVSVAAPVIPIHQTVTEIPVSTGKVSMEVSGNVSVRIKLDDSNETVEVKRVGENLSISFADGKSVHLPLKTVA